MLGDGDHVGKEKQLPLNPADQQIIAARCQACNLTETTVRRGGGKRKKEKKTEKKKKKGYKSAVPWCLLVLREVSNPAIRLAGKCFLREKKKKAGQDSKAVRSTNGKG